MRRWINHYILVFNCESDKIVCIDMNFETDFKRSENFQNISVNFIPMYILFIMRNSERGYLLLGQYLTLKVLQMALVYINEQKD